ncbi:hypothetical protein Krad_2570 [Kineococcus radiotolerans SRS30216 = ATCC BAA-149]|uniref:Uncharacterized protein n=1 Tax=Kineococcus radiotolerans (strain ATCC BAA-149 / DSM 14245 / SRS30216) TaxID=266940 RepID=A6WB56_KINRD|nr:hypothetical protein Krad_2570 [Kineococcus radiotolerans SRS30216 = ATCC BAA-149]
MCCDGAGPACDFTVIPLPGTLMTSPLPRRRGHSHDDRPTLTDEGLELSDDLTVLRAHRQQVLSSQLLLLLVLDPEGAGSTGCLDPLTQGLILDGGNGVARAYALTQTALVLALNGPQHPEHRILRVPDAHPARSRCAVGVETPEYQGHEDADDDNRSRRPVGPQRPWARHGVGHQPIMSGSGPPGGRSPPPPWHHTAGTHGHPALGARSWTAGDVAVLPMSALRAHRAGQQLDRLPRHW